MGPSWTLKTFEVVFPLVGKTRKVAFVKKAQYKTIQRLTYIYVIINTILTNQI